MKWNHSSKILTCGMEYVVTGALLFFLMGQQPALATLVGQSALISALDYSDTFTTDIASRPGIFHHTHPDAVDAYYNLESGSPTAQWHPTGNFSFNIPANAVPEYPSYGNTGNPGAATGFAQSGGGDFNFAYGMRNHFIVQVDAAFTTDYIVIGSYDAVGRQRGAANTLSVIFRRSSISLHNGIETATGFNTGIAAGDHAWHNYAVEFDKDINGICFFVDEVLIGFLNLDTFANGIYKSYSSAAVGAGVNGYVGWIDNLQVGTPANGSSMLIDSHRMEKVSIANTGSIGTLIDTGRLIKQGGGTLSITNAHLGNGTVEVKAGTLDLGTGVGDLPAALRSGLVFWVDANRNIELSGSEVTTWHDVREMEGGTIYPRARKYGTDPAPTLVQGGEDVSALKLVDFGVYGGGQWLQWQDAASNRWSIANIRTVFMVVSCPNGYGFLLGDWDDSSATANAGTGDFHAGGNTGDGNPAGAALKNAAWWGAGFQAVYAGKTFINGDFINGLEQVVSSSGEMMSLATVNNAQASNFGNNRNYKVSDNINGVFIDRQGGGRIGEVLIYSTAMTKSQRRMVESYLMKKWLHRDLGIVQIAQGATLTVRTDATRNPSVDQVSGSGTLNVQGSGRVMATAAALASPPIRLGVGASVDSGTLFQRAGLPYVLEGGSEYIVSNGITARQTLPDGTLIEKTGDGVLTATTIPVGVQCVSVKAGTLRLAPALPDVPSALTSALANASFESFTSVGTGGDIYWGYNPAGTEWTLRGDMSAASGADWSAGGMLKPSAGTPWCATQTAPDGDWAMFLKRAGELERSFEVPAPGRYEIAFYTAARPGYVGHLYQVLVDEVNVIGSIRSMQTEFSRISCVTPLLAAGVHTLCFKGDYGTADRASVIDAIEISPCSAADDVAIPNSGFEETAIAFGDGSCYEYTPANASWNFVTNSGITAGNNLWYYTQLEHGGQTAFLQQACELSMPVTFPAPGLYCLSFRAAARVAYWGGYAWNNGHDFVIKLNGTQAVRLATWKPSFDSFSVVLPTIKEGDPLTQTLAFVGVNSLGGDRASLIDDVRIVRIPLIANPSFETSAALLNGTWEAGITNAGWEFCSGIAERNQSGIAKSGSDWGNTAPEGGCNAFLQMQATIRQTVTFEVEGTYTVSFLAAGRSQQNHYLTHDFQVTFNGMQVGYVQTLDGIFRRYTFRLPCVKANTPCLLSFEGINHGDTFDRASFIDSVMFAKIDDPAFDNNAFAKTKLVLAAGTTLDLDYDGLVTLESVKYNGHSHSGVLSADNTAFIRGAGTLYAAPKGTLIIIQ